MLKVAQVLNLTVCYLKTRVESGHGWSWFVACQSVTVCLQIPVTEFCFHFPVTVRVGIQWLQLLTLFALVH